ncbi:WD repeat-containing protein, partial [Reticulomyxa filosa]
MSNQIFQNLKELSTPLFQAQCVTHKHEILICGGNEQRACYSYHTIKNDYKFICEYPSDVGLYEHCVVKMVNNNKHSNQVTLLSFGGGHKYTLLMKYVSVWSNRSNNHNQWIPFTDNHNHPIIIGKDENHYYIGVRAVIGGSNGNLLFITYPNNISVFDLNTFQFIKHDKLPTRTYIQFHCFVSKSENRQGQEIMKTNQKKINKIIKCCCFVSRQVYQLNMMKITTLFNFINYLYAYVYINDTILFFGGSNCNGSVVSNSVHKYSIREKKWMTFKDIFPVLLYNCSGVLNEDNNHIHIIGTSAHMKIIVDELLGYIQPKNETKFVIQHWFRILKIRLGWINDFNKIIIKYVRGFELLTILRGHGNTVNSARFSADGRKIVSASYDHTVRLWDVISEKQIQIFRGHTDRVFAARFSPDGNTIVSCSGDGTIRLWDINTGKEVTKLKNDSSKIWDVNFSPDGRYIVSSLQDNTIRLWDVHSRIEIKQLSGHLRD